MSNEFSWRKASRRKLTEILFEQTPRGEEESFAAWGKRLKKAIADGYPFAQRRGFAYQCWLSERKKLLADLGLAEPPPKPTKAQRSQVAQASQQGQLSVFELTPPIAVGHGKDPSRIQLPLKQEVVE